MSIKTIKIRHFWLQENWPTWLLELFIFKSWCYFVPSEFHVSWITKKKDISDPFGGRQERIFQKSNLTPPPPPRQKYVTAKASWKNWTALMEHQSNVNRQYFFTLLFIRMYVHTQTLDHSTHTNTHTHTHTDTQTHTHTHTQTKLGAVPKLLRYWALVICGQRYCGTVYKSAVSARH